LLFLPIPFPCIPAQTISYDNFSLCEIFPCDYFPYVYLPDDNLSCCRLARSLLTRTRRTGRVNSTSPAPATPSTSSLRPSSSASSPSVSGLFSHLVLPSTIFSQLGGKLSSISFSSPHLSPH
jgi:hypothetical protein